MENILSEPIMHWGLQKTSAAFCNGCTNFDGNTEFLINDNIRADQLVFHMTSFSDFIESEGEFFWLEDWILRNDEGGVPAKYWGGRWTNIFIENEYDTTIVKRVIRAYEVEYVFSVNDYVPFSVSGKCADCNESEHKFVDSIKTDFYKIYSSETQDGWYTGSLEY